MAHLSMLFFLAAGLRQEMRMKLALSFLLRLQGVGIMQIPCRVFPLRASKPDPTNACGRSQPRSTHSWYLVLSFIFLTLVSLTYLSTQSGPIVWRVRGWTSGGEYSRSTMGPAEDGARWLTEEKWNDKTERQNQFTKHLRRGPEV